MNLYLEHLNQAFNNVPDYYRNNQIQNSKPYYINEQGIELSFMTELYHQWKLITLDDKLYNDLNLQATIGKRIIGRDNPKQQSVEFPDLVLHKGQDGEPNLNNIVFVEIKMDNYDSNDVSKIFRGLKFLEYEYGVYIISNSNNTSIVNNINTNFNSDFLGYQEYFENFYFLTYTDGLVSLCDLLKSKIL